MLCNCPYLCSDISEEEEYLQKGDLLFDIYKYVNDTVWQDNIIWHIKS